MKALHIGNDNGVEHWVIDYGTGSVKDYFRREIDSELAMPFDKFDMENGFVHATGFDYWDAYTGSWMTEYEDSVEYLIIVGEYVEEA